MTDPQKPAEPAAPEPATAPAAPAPAPDAATPDTSTDLPPADPEAMANETTPVGDQVETEVTADAPETADSFKVDVQRALQRETQDGKGDEDPGPSDWNGYATEGVEVEVEEATQ